MHQDDPIAAYKRLVEARIQSLLERAGLNVQVGELQSIVFDYHHTRFKSYCAQLSTMFRTAGISLDEHEVLAAIQDVWNFFPHKSLRGRSPAEIFVGLASAEGAGLI